MQPLKRHAVMRCARSRSSPHIVFFLPVRLLFPTLLSDTSLVAGEGTVSFLPDLFLSFWMFSSAWFTYSRFHISDTQPEAIFKLSAKKTTVEEGGEGEVPGQV